MDSWLKAAEGLFEVVDRRAKLVVSELSEEQSDSLSSASKGRELVKVDRKSNAKVKRRVSATESPANGDKDHKRNTTQKEHDVENKDVDCAAAFESSISFPVGISEKAGSEMPPEADAESQYIEFSPNVDVESAETNSTEIKHDVTDRIDANNELKEPIKESSLDASLSLATTDDAIENTARQEKNSVSQSETTKVKPFNSPVSVSSSESNLTILDGHGSSSSEKSASGNERKELQIDNNFPRKQTDARESHKKSQQESTKVTASKVQDQLDEAQGLLESTNASGQSKEARLAKVCAGLSSRLQEYKSENAQLEELLAAERELSSSYETQIKQLQLELSEASGSVSKIESNMADALSAKNSEIETLQSTIDGLKKHTAVSDEKLASLQADMETVVRSRELTETRMMQALREELASAERRAEGERAAHSATKMAAMEREVELEHRAVEASTALARIQRALDERNSKVADLEQKVALLEVECASLSQELQDMEVRARHGDKKSPEEANQTLKIQAWQEEVERARQAQRDTESKLSSLEAELQKMRVEMAGMKREAEHYSRQEHIELEKRYRELTDLLYYKQTQLEAMASEKAAAEFQLAKEAKRFQDAQVEAEKNRTSRRSSWEEENDIKSLEPLPLHHRHMVGATMQLQKAVKLIDSGAVRATRFLWRYPVARVILVFYMVFVHLFLMYLLHRLQEQADSFAAKEVAESMGLTSKALRGNTLNYLSLL